MKLWTDDGRTTEPAYTISSPGAFGSGELKKVSFDPVCFPLVLLEKKNKKKIYYFSVNTKNISSHVLKISENSLVLRTREFTDIFITFDEIYLVFTSKK